MQTRSRGPNLKVDTLKDTLIIASLQTLFPTHYAKDKSDALHLLL